MLKHDECGTISNYLCKQIHLMGIQLLIRDFSQLDIRKGDVMLYVEQELG